jgi:UDP-N-acetylmuramoylalanine--D-glutamate ligase
MGNLKKIIFKAKMLPISQTELIEKNGAWIIDNKLVAKYDDAEFEILINELSLNGRHNVYNSMATAVTGKILDVSNSVIRSSLMGFKGIEHRLEKVRKVRGIEFINDSKATNVNSAWYALESMQGKIIWIAGGTDKGNDYSSLYNLVEKKVKAIVCLGIDNKKIFDNFRNLTPVIIETRSAKEAVEKSFEIGESGDTVLLSPACASFDLFENYEDRGRQFKKAVEELEI